MLGKEQMTRHRSIAKLHNLAAGSQTVPNSVAETAAARGKSPTVCPAPPTLEQRQPPLKKTKRKAARVVSDEEEDESPQEGSTFKRKRATAVESSANEGVTPDYAENPPSASTPFESADDALPSNASAAGNSQEQLADNQTSPQPAAEQPSSPPHPEAALTIQPDEGGGGENQPTTPLPAPTLPAPLQEALKSFTAHFSAIAVENLEKCLPQIVGEALKDSLNKFEIDNRLHQEEANTARAQADKLRCDITMQGLEFSRVETLNAELRSLHEDNADLRQRLDAKLQEAVELENRIVSLKVKTSELEKTHETDKAEMATLKERSAKREDLLGQVKTEQDKKSEELSKTTMELAQVHEENSELKKKIDELDLDAAHVLTSSFGAALEQFACEFPDLDLSKFSVYNEVVDGKIAPST